MGNKFSQTAPTFIFYVALMGAMGCLNTLTALHVGAVAGEWSGFIMGLYYLGFIGGAAVANTLARMIGLIAAVRAFVALLASIALLQHAGASPWGWALCRFSAGLGMAGVFVCVESWLNSNSSDAARGSVFGVYMTLGYLGDSLGQFLLRVFHVTSLFGFAVAAGVLAFAFALTHGGLWKQPGQTAQQEVRTSAAVQGLGEARTAATWLREYRLPGLLTVLAAGFLVGGHFSSAPQYLAQSGSNADAILIAMGGSMAVAMLLQVPVGRLGDRLGRVPVVRGCLVLLMCLLLAQAVQANGMLALALYCFAVGVATTLYASAVAFINDGLPATLRVSTSAVLLSLYSLAACAAPVLLQLSMKHLGAAFYPIPNAIVCLLAWVTWQVLQDKRDEKSPAHASPQGQASDPAV